MTTQSTTPRTDAECGPPRDGDDTWPSCYVTADFARELETDLAALEGCVKALKKLANHEIVLFEDGVECDLDPDATRAQIYMQGVQDGMRELQAMAAEALAAAEKEGA